MCHLTAFIWTVTAFYITFSTLGRRHEEGMGGEIVRKRVLFSIFLFLNFTSGVCFFFLVL